MAGALAVYDLRFHRQHAVQKVGRMFSHPNPMPTFCEGWEGSQERCEDLEVKKC